MNKFINLIACCIILLSSACKKEEIKEIQSSSTFELILNQNEVTANSGEITRVGFTLYQNKIPFKYNILSWVEHKIQLVENTTNDSNYSIQLDDDMLYILAPRKAGKLKFAISTFVSGIQRGEPTYFTLNITDKPIPYDFLYNNILYLVYRMNIINNNFYFGNGFAYNLLTKTIVKNQPNTIPYDYYLQGTTDNNELVLIKANGRVILYNPLTKALKNKVYPIDISSAIFFRNIAVGCSVDGNLYRFSNNDQAEYLGYIGSSCIVKNTTGFINYSNNKAYTFSTDTATTYSTTDLPDFTQFVTIINDKFYLVGQDAIYSSLNGYDNWVKIGDIPLSPKGQKPIVHVTKNAFYFAYRRESLIYITNSLNTIAYSVYNTPVDFQYIKPLDNRQILFNCYYPVFTGIFYP